MFNKTNVYLLLIPFFCLISCKKKEKTYPFSKIEVASDGGMKILNGHVFAFDSTLNCAFYGAREFKKPGFFNGIITPQFWDEANQKLASANYQTAPDTDGIDMPDVEYLEIIVYHGAQKKRMLRCNCGKQSSLIKAIKWLLDGYKMAKLTQVNDSIKFGTSYQNPPPVPAIDSILFKAP